MGADFYITDIVIVKDTALTIGALLKYMTAVRVLRVAGECECTWKKNGYSEKKHGNTRPCHIDPFYDTAIWGRARNVISIGKVGRVPTNFRIFAHDLHYLYFGSPRMDLQIRKIYSCTRLNYRTV